MNHKKPIVKLQDNEQILAFEKPNLLSILLRNWFGYAAILALAMYFATPPLTLILVVLIGAEMFASYKSYMLMVTNKRIIERSGLFSVVITEANVDKIESCDIYKPFLGRIFGYGSIGINLIGGSGGLGNGAFIGNPEEIKNMITDTIAKHKKD